MAALARPPDPAAMAAMLAACEEHYAELVGGGADADVARDRTFDAYEHAMEGGEAHCFDARDRLFENGLRTIVEREKRR